MGVEEEEEESLAAEAVGHLLELSGVLTVYALVVGSGPKERQSDEFHEGVFNAARSRTAPNHAFLVAGLENLVSHLTGVAYKDIFRHRVLSTKVCPETVPKYGPMVRVIKADSVGDEEAFRGKLKEAAQGFRKTRQGYAPVLQSSGARGDIPDVATLYARSAGCVWI